MELEYTPPGALPIKPGVVFFKVVRTPEYWNDIAGTGTIAIYQPIDPQGSPCTSTPSIRRTCNDLAPSSPRCTGPAPTR